MATIQVRNVPDEDYQALRGAAAEEGKSLQAYMKEEMSALARRARKRAAFNAVRDALAKDSGTGVTTESIISVFDEIRGPWPGSDEEAESIRRHASGD